MEVCDWINTQTIMDPIRDDTSDAQDRETVSIGKSLAGVPAVTSMYDSDHCIRMGAGVETKRTMDGCQSGAVAIDAVLKESPTHPHVTIYLRQQRSEARSR